MKTVLNTFFQIAVCIAVLVQCQEQPDNIYLSDYALTYFDALTECRTTFSGNLIGIFSVEQDMAVEALFRNQSKLPIQVWTSGRYDYMTTEWTWQAYDRPLIYENWIIYSTPKNDSCMAIAAVTLGNRYGWMPISCGVRGSTDIKLKFICQF